MTIEDELDGLEEEFNEAKLPDQMRIDRASDKLKKMRWQERKRQQDLKHITGIPTEDDLDGWFNS